MIDIKSIGDLVFRLNYWRSYGDRIVLTWGVFDLFHHGHNNYIKSAFSAGDRLVIFLDSDEKALFRKGVGRPIDEFATRAQNILRTGCVDLVVEFPLNATNLTVLEMVRPDILVVSNESGEAFGDRQYTLPFPLEIRVIQRTEGISTTQILNATKE